MSKTFKDEPYYVRERRPNVVRRGRYQVIAESKRESERVLAREVSRRARHEVKALLMAERFDEAENYAEINVSAFSERIFA